jgi:bifunctional ADP-heptose synthase (sugar kinase/adenylyltransferase)
MSGNVVENLRALGVDYNDITHWCQFTPITKTRYVDKKSNHMFIRVDEGEDLVKEIDDVNMNQYFDVIIVSDYNKGLGVGVGVGKEKFFVLGSLWVKGEA